MWERRGGWETRRGVCCAETFIIILVPARAGADSKSGPKCRVGEGRSGLSWQGGQLGDDRKLLLSAPLSLLLLLLRLRLSCRLFKLKSRRRARTAYVCRPRTSLPSPSSPLSFISCFCRPWAFLAFYLASSRTTLWLPHGAALKRRINCRLQVLIKAPQRHLSSKMSSCSG